MVGTTEGHIFSLYTAEIEPREREMCPSHPQPEGGWRNLSQPVKVWIIGAPARYKKEYIVSNLQIMALALHYATGRSARYWTKVLQRVAKSDPVIAANLATIPPDHLERLEKLQQEGAGILQWLLK